MRFGLVKTVHLTTSRRLVKVLPFLSALIIASSPAPWAVAVVASTPVSAELSHFVIKERVSEVDDLVSELVEATNVERIEAFHKVLTKNPHVAGTQGSYDVARYIRQSFEEAGLETAVDRYSVLLSYPEDVSLRLVVPEEKVLPLEERPVPEDGVTEHPDVSVGHLGYSGSGEVEAEVVYANYGRESDYEQLNALGVDVRHKVVLARYGAIFRGTKVRIAEEHGAAAVLLYSDPRDDGYHRGDVYPDGPWRPSGSIQRGSLEYLEIYAGDPLTPEYASPAVDDDALEQKRPLFVSDASDQKPLKRYKVLNLPGIPALPLSYGNALEILKALGGPAAPEDTPAKFAKAGPAYALAPPTWQGGLPITYHIGPGPARVHLRVKMSEESRPVENVIGWIEGESNEAVLIGTHHDAWVFGGVDPGGGTAVLMEMAQVIGEWVQRTGKKPKRTIVLAAWDAEEFGLIGSTEFLENYKTDLRNRLFTYFNIDGSGGPSPGVTASPHLRVLYELSAARTPYPLAPISVLDHWRQEQKIAADARPHAPPIGGGSDFAAFVLHGAIPSGWIAFQRPYGPYHSNLDTHYYVKNHIDPDFIWQREFAQWYLATLAIAAFSDRYPFVVEDYVDAVIEAMEALSPKLESESVQPSILEEAREALSRWKDAANAFDTLGRKIIAEENDSAIKTWSNLAKDIDQRFLTKVGLPGRSWYKHQLWGARYDIGVGTVAFPYIADRLMRNETLGLSSNVEQLTQLFVEQAITLEAFVASIEH